MASIILFNQLAIEWDELVEPVLFSYRVPLLFRNRGSVVKNFDKGDEKGEVDWVRHITWRLQAAFDLVRERQAEAADKNKERDKRRFFDPDWKEGDNLLLWETSNTQTTFAL